MSALMRTTRGGGSPKKSFTGVQSIHRAVELLRVIARSNEQGIRLTSISQELGIKTTTTHRLLSSLVDEGLAAYDNISKHYFLGLELANLGVGAYKLTLIDACRNVLDRVCQKTEDTVFLFMRSGSAGLCLKRIEGRYPVRTLTINEGDYRPLGIGAGSLAILTYLPDKLIKRILAGNGKTYAQFNHSAETVLSWIEATHDLGYAWSDQDISRDVCAVGLPVRNRDDEVVAAVSVAAIPNRMTKARREKIVELIREEIRHVVIPLSSQR